MVIDASAVVDLLVGSPLASSIRDGVAGAGDLHAPELVDPEVLSVLRRFHGRKVLDARVADRAVRELGDLRLLRHSHGPLRKRIWALRDRCSAYDACYVALADALDLPLLTTDDRLARAAHGLVEVVPIARG